MDPQPLVFSHHKLIVPECLELLCLKKLCMQRFLWITREFEISRGSAQWQEIGKWKDTSPPPLGLRLQCHVMSWAAFSKWNIACSAPLFPLPWYSVHLQAVYPAGKTCFCVLLFTYLLHYKHNSDYCPVSFYILCIDDKWSLINRLHVKQFTWAHWIRCVCVCVHACTYCSFYGDLFLQGHCQALQLCHYVEVL